MTAERFESIDRARGLQASGDAAADRATAQFEQARFALLEQNLRLAPSAGVVGVAVFGWALSRTGATDGFGWWAAAAVTVAAGYYLVDIPLLTRLSDAGRFDVASRTQVVYDFCWGVVWGVAAVFFFEPDPVRLMVIVGMVMANIVAASTATAVH
jgi:hypothetical protein